jgi:uncharacterized protein
MGRVLVLILIVVLAVWLIRRALRPASPKPKPEKAQAAVEGDLVACARCGINLPRNDAREAGGAVYCSDEHAKLGRTPGSGPA